VSSSVKGIRFKLSTCILSFVLILLFLNGCKSKLNTSAPLEFSGETMGTTYSIKLDKEIKGIQFKVDSTLLVMNKIFSTYDSTSQISKINYSSRQITCISDTLLEFINVLNLSKKIFESTNQYFDPTVMPLVNYWGFGPEKLIRDDIDSLTIDSLLNLVGLMNINWTNIQGNLCVKKHHPNASIDLSAIAKGYAVDAVARLLQKLGVQNYMVEIGGEVVAKGLNENNEVWKIGIDQPKSSNDLENRQLQAIVELKDKALATSGNYRNFHEINGEIIGHTINPKTGRPEINNLLAVSVLADDCATADGFATGFMAMGYEQALKIANELEQIDAYFIYLDEQKNIKTSYTAGFEAFLVPIEN
jgi:thiamine biosynthesis lipoprotein